ncbi:FAD-NAD(P)-binding protein [Saccharopolyspora erythraea NRRL 2338]|uniref:FAD/NAD(P)-binding protein n=1 Tax=Saccharopolyspora erythraea TaxID=1836 RepID=A0ABN1CC39_SACER|nr:FAD/NAD(P)-binding protein [Saccharopolyspora erythraea]EQD85606.1 adenylate cyclase [Saccharopolyspora erythraea D]PFG96939.1 FAD-NAD(P)-binding protein [Saccharopolyspora erythraea NRRL 2338]
MSAHLVVVGAGPRGAGLLERIGASAPELFATGTLTVHLVDPHPPGAGRLWRADQPESLWMNSMAEDVTMFLDSSVRCEGPVRGGPSLSEWAREAVELEASGSPGPLDDLPDRIAVQVRAMTGRTFAGRQVQSAYLSWFFDRAVSSLPANVSVRVHEDDVVGLEDLPDGRQRVRLAEGADLLADIVVLAMGHTDAEPDGEHARLREFARDHDLFYLAPEYSADAGLDRLRPGEDVIMRGFGLAFVDLMVLLTEGRGGRYRRSRDGTLTYLPSGREPRIHVGSRRGVPYRSKIGYGLQGPRPSYPRFFGPEQIERLPRGADFGRDVWPLIEKELGWGHYHELFTAHPDRVTTSWEEFAERYARLPQGSPELAALVADAVPKPEDRLDVPALDRPLAGRSFSGKEELQTAVREHVAADLARRDDPRHSADLGVFLALLSVYGQLPAVFDKLGARSHVRQLDGWFYGFFNYVASGPPGPRLQQLLALSRAGVLSFVGAGMWVRAVDGEFQAGGASTGDVVRARALVEAKLPAPTMRRSRNALLRDMVERGAAVEETLVEEDFRHVTGRLLVTQESARVVNREGRAHPRRYALGPYTSGRAMAAFARPHTNSPGFRKNDAVAREILSTLAEMEQTHRACA